MTTVQAKNITDHCFFRSSGHFVIPLVWCEIVLYAGTTDERTNIDCAWANDAGQAIRIISDRYARSEGFLSEEERGSYHAEFIRNTRVEIMGVTEGMFYEALKNLFMDSPSGYSVENGKKFQEVMQLLNRHLREK